MEHLYDCLTFSEKNLNKKITHLESSLIAFSQITGTPVSFFTSSGKYQWSTLPDKRLCNANPAFGKEDIPCTQNLLSAMETSLALPETYVFMCESGMIHLCCALVIDDKIYGYLMAGPIVMGSDMEKTIASFFRKPPSEAMDYARLLSLLKDMRIYTPREISYLSTLFQDVITSPLNLHAASDTRYQRSKEQITISSKLLELKKDQLTVEYPYQTEQNLIDLIRSGDVDHCGKQFSKYMEDIMVFEGGNLSIIKLRLIAFMTQILKSEDVWQRDYKNLYSLEKINEAQTLKELVQSGKSLVISLAESAFSVAYNGSSSGIKKLLLYLNTHYSENITLKSAADRIHVNPTYLSTLFKQETGVPFITYLTDLRLNYAKEFLRNTTIPIAEIALRTGFSSSSYFTKVFKEKYGITPKEFRQSRR